MEQYLKLDDTFTLPNAFKTFCVEEIHTDVYHDTVWDDMIWIKILFHAYIDETQIGIM